MSPAVVPWVVSHSHLNPKDRFNLQVERGIRFSFTPKDRVLDVGPMCFPFPYATHRMGCDERDDPKDGKPFYLGDIQKRTPYPDKYFDYVYSSHILEHVDDPVAAAAEISRIGKQGYVEVPSGYSTIFLCYGLIHPKWFFYQDDNGTLAFAPWDKKVLKVFEDVEARGAMDRIVNGLTDVDHLNAREQIMHKFYYKYADLFDPCQLWKGKIRMRKGAWFA